MEALQRFKLDGYQMVNLRAGKRDGLFEACETLP
jgi:hypothetical protein